MIKSTIYLQELSSEGNFQYTHPEEIVNRVKEIAAKENVKLYGTKLVGFTPDEAYRRAVNALCEDNATAWKCSTEYRMWGLFVKTFVLQQSISRESGT